MQNLRKKAKSNLPPLPPPHSNFSPNMQIEVHGKSIAWKLPQTKWRGTRAGAGAGALMSACIWFESGNLCYWTLLYANWNAQLTVSSVHFLASNCWSCNAYLYVICFKKGKACRDICVSSFTLTLWVVWCCMLRCVLHSCVYQWQTLATATHATISSVWCCTLRYIYTPQRSLESCLSAAKILIQYKYDKVYESSWSWKIGSNVVWFSNPSATPTPSPPPSPTTPCPTATSTPPTPSASPAPSPLIYQPLC